MTTIDQLLAQHDARRGKKAGDKQAAHARAEHSRFIAKHFVLYDHLRAHLFHPHQHPIVAFSQQENHLPEYFHKLGWIKPAGNQRWRVSNDDDIRVYLSGGWLEELVFLAHEAAGADEVYFGQDIEWTVNNIHGKNEIDVIARRGDVLSFTSCKAIRPEKSAAHMEQLRGFLTETDYWNIHFANDKGRALLVVTADFMDEYNKSHRYPSLAARAFVLCVDMAGLEQMQWDRLVQAIEQHWSKT